MAIEPESRNSQEALGQVIERIPITRVHYLALILVVTGGLFEVLEQLILSALGPALQKAFGIGAQSLAFLSTATLLAIVVGGLLGGYFADRLGRRNVLAISVGVYSLGSVLSALSPDYTFLTISRVVTGIGVGAEIAVGLAYLSELTPTRIRGLFVSLFNTISAGVGMFVAYAYAIFVLGPFAAVVGAGDEGWRWAFGLLGIPAVLVFFLRRYLPETPRYLMERGQVHKLNDSLTRLAKGKLRLGRDEQPTLYFDPADSAAFERSAPTEILPKKSALRALFEGRKRQWPGAGDLGRDVAFRDKSPSFAEPSSGGLFGAVGHVGVLRHGSPCSLSWLLVLGVSSGGSRARLRPVLSTPRFPVPRRTWCVVGWRRLRSRLLWSLPWHHQPFRRIWTVAPMSRFQWMYWRSMIRSPKAGACCLLGPVVGVMVRSGLMPLLGPVLRWWRCRPCPA